MLDVQEWQQKMADLRVRADAVIALSALRMHVAEVTRDWSNVVYDEAKHPRGSNGRYIGGAGKDALDVVREHERVHEFIGDAKYGAYKAAQEGGRRAGKEYLRTVTYGEHQGIEAIKAHEAALKQRLNDLVRQMSPRDVQEMQALQREYYAHSWGQYQLRGLRYDDPGATTPPENTRLSHEYQLMFKVAKAYNREQRKLWAAEQREGKPPKWATTDAAWKKAHKAVGKQTIDAITQHLDALNEKARVPYEAEQARIRAENRDRRLRDEINSRLHIPREDITPEMMNGWEADREGVIAQHWASYEHDQEERTKALLPVVTRDLLGREMTKDDIRATLGLGAKAELTIVVSRVNFDEQIHRDELRVTVQDGHFKGDFTLYRNNEGKLVALVGTVDNSERHVQGGRTLAAAVDGRQIIHTMQGFQRLGVQYVACTAARANGQYNGYYSWPRMGFMGDIPDLILPEVQKAFGKDVTRVEQLFALPGGQKWWRDNGVTFHATFDFADGSHSRQIFDHFVQALDRANGEKRMMYPNVTMDNAFNRAADEAWAIVYPPGSKSPQPSEELLKVETEAKKPDEQAHRAATPDLVTLAARSAILRMRAATILHKGKPL